LGYNTCKNGNDTRKCTVFFFFLPYWRTGEQNKYFPKGEWVVTVGVGSRWENGEEGEYAANIVYTYT
jgi:hypothetical protein